MADNIDELVVDFVTSHNGQRDYYAGRNIAAEMQAIARGEEQVAQKSGRVKQKTAELGREMRKTTTQATLLSRAFKVFGAYLAVGKLKAYADEWTNIKSILSLVTDGEEARLRVQERLFKLSQNTRQDIGSTVDLYRRISVSTEQLGLSEEKRLSLVEAINKALIIGGGTTAGNNAALIQLGQGLASGQLRGQELNSVLEQAPRLAQMIAEGMGIRQGQLRDVAKEGKLTPDVVLNAILKQAPKVDDEFEKMAMTIGQALTKLNNSFGHFLNSLNECAGITSIVSSAISLLADAFDVLAKHTQYVATIIGGLLIKRLITMRRIFLESRAPIGSMRNALQMLVSGEVIGGLKALAVAGKAAIIPFLKFALIAYAVEVVFKLLKELWKWFNGEENIFTHLGAAFEENKAEILKWFSEAKQWFVDFGEGFADALTYPFEKFWEFLLKLGEQIGEWIANIVIFIKEGISNAWDSAKGTVKGWFGSDDNERKEPRKNPAASVSNTPYIPKVPQAPIPATPINTNSNQSYNDNKTINITINEAKDGQAAYTRLSNVFDASQNQTPFRLATSGLGYSR